MKHLIEGNLHNFKKCRVNLITSLLSVKETEDMRISLKILTDERLLPFGRWSSDCPKFMDKYCSEQMGQWFDKYQSVSYMRALWYLIEDVKHKAEEEVVNRYEDFLIREIFRYVKEHRIIGFTIDW